METTLILNRNPATKSAKQTIGKLSVYQDLKQVFECFTIELPWQNNESRISCIPTDEYNCFKRNATTAIPYEHILIANVPDRDGICIHRANYYKQLKGCIAVGDKHVDINNDGELDVTNSKVTLDKLLGLLPDKFKIVIN